MLSSSILFQTFPFFYVHHLNRLVCFSLFPFIIPYSSFSLLSGIYLDDEEKGIVQRGIDLFSLKDRALVVSMDTIPEYEPLSLALLKHQKGEHSEAMKIYQDLCEKECNFAFLNLGNCFIFGLGVKTDKRKGLEKYREYGTLVDEDLEWMKKLSNGQYIQTPSLDLKFCSFFCIVLL